MPIAPAKLKLLLILAKKYQKQQLNLSHSALFHKKTRVSLKYFVTDCGSLKGLNAEKIKSDSQLLEKVVFSFNGTPSKMVENAFYFMSKALRSHDIHIFVLTF